jgi:kynurenine 3-monooxygenase
MAASTAATADAGAGRASSSPVVVVGAGLAGTMMALLLSRKGFAVELYEKRSDARIAERADAARLA